MKIIFAVLTFFFLNATAQAQGGSWIKVSPIAYRLDSNETSKVFLAASFDDKTGSVAFTVMDRTNSFCEKGENRGLSGAEIVKIFNVNDVGVRFYEGCSGGNRIILPVSDAGSAKVEDSLNQGVVNIELEYGVVFHFRSVGYEFIKKELLDGKSAL